MKHTCTIMYVFVCLFICLTCRCVSLFRMYLSSLSNLACVLSYAHSVHVCVLGL